MYNNMLSDTFLESEQDVQVSNFDDESEWLTDEDEEIEDEEGMDDEDEYDYDENEDLEIEEDEE